MSRAIAIAATCALGVAATACSAGSGPLGPASGTSAGNGGAQSLSTAGGAVNLSEAGGSSAGAANTGPGCNPKTIGLVRDFRQASIAGGHPDFEDPTLFVTKDYDPKLGYPERGIVTQSLGADHKPVFSGGTFRTVHSKQSFDEWYRDVSGVNMTFQYELPLAEDPTTHDLVFDTSRFFPIDNRGYGNSGVDDDGVEHNFGFTFELHMTFGYHGGEVFRFRGDDDVFVFINGKLAIDLGGVHAPMEGDVSLDAQASALGLAIGQEYPIDVFQAERHTTQSNFRVETTLSFTNCQPILFLR